MYQYGPGTYARRLPISALYSMADVRLASAIHDMYVYRFLFFLVCPWGILPLQSDWSLSCDHGLDDVRASVRATAEVPPTINHQPSPFFPCKGSGLDKTTIYFTHNKTDIE